MKLDQPDYVGLRVMVADSDREGAETLKSLLTLLRCDVWTAVDADDMEWVARRTRPHLLLCDLSLVTFDVPGALGAVRRACAPAQVLCVFLTDDVQEALHFRRAGFDRVIQKPASLETMLGLLGEAYQWIDGAPQAGAVPIVVQ